MQYRLLGNSGLRVSEAALGTMTFGDEWGWGSAKDEARKVYDAFREAGGNFIDTANFYTNGTSESFLGEFMKGHRQSVVTYAGIATSDAPSDSSWEVCPMGTAEVADGSRLRASRRSIKGIARAGCKPTTSTCTGSTCGTKLRQSKRSCADWTIWFARARCSTSEFLMPPRGGSRRRIHLPDCEDGHPSSACSSNTTLSNEVWSGSWSR